MIDEKRLCSNTGMLQFELDPMVKPGGISYLEACSHKDSDGN
jgi:hypothetical protein